MNKKLYQSVIVSGALAFSSTFIFANQSFAAPIQRLSAYLDQELQSIGSALDEADASSGSADESSAWSVKNFYLRLQASVGFSLPSFVSVDLVPQLELVFHRRETEGL